MMARPSSSPWGKIQTCRKLDEGVYRVSTAGHGGIMVHSEVAVNEYIKKINNKYRSSGINWLTFEEDSEVALIIYEFRKTNRADLSPTWPDESLIKILTKYYHQILEVYGDKQDDETARVRVREESYDNRRKSQDPKLIVSKQSIGNFVILYCANKDKYISKIQGILGLEIDDYPDKFLANGLWLDDKFEYLKELNNEAIKLLSELYEISKEDIAQDKRLSSYIHIKVQDDFKKSLKLVRQGSDDFEPREFPEVELKEDSEVYSCLFNHFFK